MDREIRLYLRGDVDSLGITELAVRSALAGLSLGPDQDPHEILIAVQEMLTNILRHGYGGDCSRPVEVVLRTDDGRFEIVMMDQAPAFDPTAAPDPAFDVRREGGYGIFLAREIMDDVHYARVGDTNVLTMAKRVRAQARGSRKR